MTSTLPTHMCGRYSAKWLFSTERVLWHSAYTIVIVYIMWTELALLTRFSMEYGKKPTLKKFILFNMHYIN